MTAKLGDAIDRLATVSGMSPDKAADHVAKLALSVVDRAEERATAAARKVFETAENRKRPGRKARAAGATAQ
jgi:hypothetical protein